jgi:hypothetical protein
MPEMLVVVMHIFLDLSQKVFIHINFFVLGGGGWNKLETWNLFCAGNLNDYQG